MWFIPRVNIHNAKGNIAKLNRCRNRGESTIKKVNKTQYVVK